LQDYLTKKLFLNHEVESKAVKLKLDNTDTSLKEVEKLVKDQILRSDDFRKRIQRITSE